MTGNEETIESQTHNLYWFKEILQAIKFRIVAVHFHQTHLLNLLLQVGRTVQ